MYTDIKLASNNWLGVKKIYPNGAIYIPADYCFIELALCNLYYHLIKHLINCS